MKSRRLFSSFFLILIFMFGIHSGCSSQGGGNSVSKKDRAPAAAGRFYPSDPAELRSMLAGLFAEAKAREGQRVAAVICPHAGYVFSGIVAASGISQVDPDKTYDNVFIIASSHQIAFNGASIYNQGDYITPLGTVPVNLELANQLIRDHDLFTYNPEADLHEHSAEVQVPFLQFYLKKPFRLVPIILGTQSPQTCKKIAQALKPYFNDKNLFIVSSDFSHYPEYNDAKAADKATCDAIVKNNPENLVKFLDSYRDKEVDNLATNLCGWTSVLTLLYITAGDQDYTYRPVQYMNSGDSKYGDKDQVVGYWSIGVVSAKPVGKDEVTFEFSSKEKAELLAIARNTIIRFVSDRKIPPVDTTEFTANMKVHAGAFVTLKQDRQLRGCIGRFTSDEPLWKLVQEMAIASATQDYRFDPVAPAEVPGLEIEISVLTPLKRIKSIDEIELGRHGIYIKKGINAGTFLPQVATETGWSKEQFLGHCSRDKAQIGWDGWRDAEIFTYEAIVFSESNVTGHIK